MKLNHILTFAKSVVADTLAPGDTAIDATAGNGFDTLHLSRAVGPAGRVFAFDIQQAALDSTRRRLEKENAPDNVTLLLAGHETMREHIPAELHGIVGAAMFNLGFLPHSDQTVVTKPKTTIRAIEASLSLLRKGGVASLALYSGHPGGAEEAQAVNAFCSSLPLRQYKVMHCGMLNQPNSQLQVILIGKS